ncbi:MAG: tetratricopeptide repeat protein [Candidatus Methylacidiphilales bacterium]|nr:tetratricopeptide repeat protein [Candidatus Methylacidiphilales bacterium]
MFTLTPLLLRGQSLPPQVHNPLPEIEEDLENYKNPTPTAAAGRPQRAAAAAAFALGLQLEQQGRATEALARFRQAVQDDPQYIPAQARVALSLLKSNRPTEALESVAASLARQPQSPELMALRALVHVHLNQLREASLWAEKSRTLNPLLVVNYATLASVALAEDKPARLRQLFQEAQKIKTDRADYYARQALLWIQVLPSDGKTLPSEAARETAPLLKQASSLDPDNLSLRLASGQAAFQAGNIREALAEFSVVEKRRPNLPLLRLRIGECHLKLQQYAEALPYFEWLYDRDPSQRQLLPAIGELHAKLGQWAKASEFYQQAVIFAPPEPRVYFALAEAQTKAGEHSACLATLDDAQRRFPNLPAFPYLRAMVLFAQGDYPASLEAFVKTETLALGGLDSLLNREFYFRKAVCAEKAAERVTMELALRRCLDMNPDDHEALNFLGYSLAERGERLEEARALILRAVELQPTNGAYLDSLGWVHYQQGRYRHARAYLARAEKKMPGDPVVLEHLGDAWLKLGHPARARECWTRALEKSENPTSVREKIQQLPPDTP